MKSIILIIPYFGKWPIWFEANLVSVAGNPSINWLCPTNCKIPDAYPDNIKFVSMELDELNEKVNEIVSAKVPLNPRKFCDLKPAYGHIFAEYLHGYDFWGFCDLDIIWGDIRAFITEEFLDNYDVISSRKHAISGHFNLFRNTEKLNSLYKSVPDYKNLFEEPKFMWFDEEVLTNYLLDEATQENIKVYWETYLLNNSNGKAHQEYYLDRWLWKEGKMFQLKRGKIVEEVMYLHFINWKRTLKKCDIKFSMAPKSFYVSYNHIHFTPHDLISRLFNDIKNVFFGFHARMKRIRVITKFKRFLK